MHSTSRDKQSNLVVMHVHVLAEKEKERENGTGTLFLAWLNSRARGENARS